MSADAHEDIPKVVRGYFVVFGALLILTVVTVAISYIHLPLPWAITIALVVATVKASLVALYFMHLISEKQIIYYMMGTVMVTFFILIFLLMFEYHNVITGTKVVA